MEKSVKNIYWNIPLSPNPSPSFRTFLPLFISAIKTLHHNLIPKLQNAHFDPWTILVALLDISFPTKLPTHSTPLKSSTSSCVFHPHRLPWMSKCICLSKLHILTRVTFGWEGRRACGMMTGHGIVPLGMKMIISTEEVLVLFVKLKRS